MVDVLLDCRRVSCLRIEQNDNGFSSVGMADCRRGSSFCNEHVNNADS